MSRWRSARRVGSGSDGGVVSTPMASARAPRPLALDHAVAASGQARIDPQDEHAYDATRRVRHAGGCPWRPARRGRRAPHGPIGASSGKASVPFTGAAVAADEGSVTISNAAPAGAPTPSAPDRVPLGHLDTGENDQRELVVELRGVVEVVQRQPGAVEPGPPRAQGPHHGAARPERCRQDHGHPLHHRRARARRGPRAHVRLGPRHATASRCASGAGSCRPSRRSTTVSPAGTTCSTRPSSTDSAATPPTRSARPPAASASSTPSTSGSAATPRA